MQPDAGVRGATDRPPRRPTALTGWSSRLLAAGVLVGLGVAAWLLYEALWPRSIDAEVERAFGDPTAAFGMAAPYTAAPARVRGRVLAIEAYAPANQRYGSEPGARWRLSRVMAYLPSALAARSPAEVGTIARVDCEETAVGDYVQRASQTSPRAVGAAAYRTFCEVALVDAIARRTIHRQQFAGEPPPREVVAGHVARYGSAPIEEIAEWLAGLPRG